MQATKSDPVQLDILQAIEAKEAGMQQAVDNAERLMPSWSEEAYNHLKNFLQIWEGLFMCEDVRKWSEDAGLPAAPSARAWGSIIARANREGLIKSCGIQAVKNVKAHRANASVWIKK